MKSEEIDREALIAAIETELPEVQNFLDLRTGDVLTIVGPLSEDETELEALDEIALDNRHLAELVRAEPERYELIPSIASEAAFRWMQEFTATVADDLLRQRLQQTLRACDDDCFKAFRDALLDAPEEERERWFAFRDEKIVEFIDTWLEGRAEEQS
ncbi:MAG TPA: UPF0158 family protein [Pyrinomonadaceae bacterium]|jgi:hypothetical protein